MDVIAKNNCTPHRFSQMPLIYEKYWKTPALLSTVKKNSQKALCSVYNQYILK